MQRCLIPYFKINDPFSTPRSFSNNFLTPSQNQQNGKPICADFHHIPKSYILFYPLGFIGLQNLWCIFLKPVYPTMVGKIFKFMVFRLLENAFVSQKIEFRHFHTYPRLLHRQISPSVSYHHLSCITPQAVFFRKPIPPAERWEETMCYFSENILWSKVYTEVPIIVKLFLFYWSW